MLPGMLQQRNALKLQRSQRESLNVVITGGTRGLGRAFAEEFSRYGDQVFVLARNPVDIASLMKTQPSIQGFPCDVGDKLDLHRNLKAITSMVDGIDIWINNAGISGGSRNLLDLADETIEDIVKTNLFGTCMTCKFVHEVMIKQPQGGAIFNLAGAGSDGSPTPSYPVYGASKAGIVQLSKSLQKEWKDTNVDVHIISPGMMLTDLLMDNLPIDTMKVIDFLCSHPEIVALHLVPRIRNAYFHDEESYIRFLTLFKIIGRFFTRKVGLVHK